MGQFVAFRVRPIHARSWGKADIKRAKADIDRDSSPGANGAAPQAASGSDAFGARADTGAGRGQRRLINRTPA